MKWDVIEKANTSLKKKYLEGALKLRKANGEVFIETAFDLITERLNAKQQVVLNNHQVHAYTFARGYDSYRTNNYSGDSVYYRKALSIKEKALLTAVEQGVQLESLKEYYNNRCLMSGFLYSFSFESTIFSKEVIVSNYYDENVAFIIDFINKIAPKAHRLWYGKKDILWEQKACGKATKDDLTGS